MKNTALIVTKDDTMHYSISTRLLMDEALRKGYSVKFYSSSPSTRSGVTRCEKDGKVAYFKSTITASTPAFGVFAAENKALTDSLLGSADVPMPITHVLAEADKIDDAYYMLGSYTNLVVKPVDTNHGDGISVGVNTRKKLADAVKFARNAGGKEPDVLIQQQVQGLEYRFLVVDGRVIAVAGRKPPFVIGDGVSNVEQLIAIKNQDPRRGIGHTSELTLIDTKDVEYHRGLKYMHRVPADGEHTQLLDTSNLSRGGEAVDYTDTASIELKKLAIRAAESTFLAVAGIDIMTDDIAATNLDNTYVIEVNCAPGIRMHQFPGEGTPRDVAKVIFSSIEKTARPIGKNVKHIGRSEHVALPEMFQYDIPSRIDTGATVSSVWASNIKETEAGLSFSLFDKQSELYTGQIIIVPEYGKRAVSSSMGHTQIRYEIKTLIVIAGRRIRTTVTLADRSTQVYPILVGRNVLRGKFIVDVRRGKVLTVKEKMNRARLDELLDDRSVT